MNTEIENMKTAVVKMLKAGQPVFFGCDVLQQEDKKLGILDLDLYDYDVSHHSITSSQVINPNINRHPLKSPST